MYLLHLLGTARIEGSAGRISGAAAQRHRIALLAFLAMARNLRAPREKLMALLWPEQPDRESRHLLNVSLHVLRKALGDNALHTEGDEIRLNGEVVSCDVADFRDARARGDLHRAIDLYGGPFLEGFFLDGSSGFAEWQDQERERLSGEFDAVLREDAEAAEKAGDWSQAVSSWRRLVSLAGDRAPITIRLMRALEMTGDRVAALEAADAHVAMLAREYAAEPSPDVLAFATRLRAEPSPAPLLFEIATIPGTPAPSSRRDSQPVAAADAPAPPRRRRLVTLGTSALAVAGFVVGTTLLAGSRSESPSVAVLPFLDLSATKDQTYLSDGLTDEVLNALARINGLRVAARSSSFQFRDPGVDIRAVGRQLGVTAVVEGSVRLDGDRLRVTAQLIDARQGFHLWSEQYDRRLVDVFAVQEDIAREVASALSAELVQGIPDTLVARATTSSEAYSLYLRGRHEWNRRSRDGIVKAVEAFEHAVALDPTYAAAYAGLADAYQLLPDYADVPAREGLAQAKTAALRAIALDSTLASAHAALGALQDDYDHDRAGSERSYRTAIALNPGYSTARHWLAIHLADDGRFPEAIAEIERARRLDPLSRIINTAAGAVRYFARDYDGSIAEYRAVLQHSPDFALAWALLGRTLFMSGRVQEGVEALARAVELSSGDPSYRAVHAASLAAAGRVDEARAIARSLEAAGEGSPQRNGRRAYVPYTELASAFIYLGEQDKALSLFERAFEERDPAVKHMKVEPLYDRVRQHPRFRALLHRAGHV